VLNNVGFAYLTVACIDTTALATLLFFLFLFFPIYVSGTTRAERSDPP